MISMENTNSDQTLPSGQLPEEPSPQGNSDGNQDLDGAAASVSSPVNDGTAPAPQSDGDDEQNEDTGNVPTSHVSSNQHLPGQGENSLLHHQDGTVQMEQDGTVDNEEPGTSQQSQTNPDEGFIRVGTPASPYQIARLNAIFYQSTHDQDRCSICQDMYEQGDVISQIANCQHNFHQVCLSPWLRKDSCPLCRGKLP